MHRLSRLSWAEWRQLLNAGSLLLLVRLGLWLLPFAAMHRLLSKLTPQIETDRRTDTGDLEMATWAVAAIGHRLPQITCLTQAYALQLLLSRRGYASQLRIGVVRKGDGRLEAHAWVERDGEILLGDLPDLAHYTALPPLENLT